MDRIEVMTIGLLILNFLLLFIMLWRVGTAVRLIKKQMNKVEVEAEIQAEEVQPEVQAISQGCLSIEESCEQEGVSLELKPKEKEELINEVLSEIFS